MAKRCFNNNNVDVDGPSSAKKFLYQTFPIICSLVHTCLTYLLYLIGKPFRRGGGGSRG